jgi:hypothetical protein
MQDRDSGWTVNHPPTNWITLLSEYVGMRQTHMLNGPESDFQRPLSGNALELGHIAMPEVAQSNDTLGATPSSIPEQIFGRTIAAIPCRLTPALTAIIPTGSGN